MWNPKKIWLQMLINVPSSPVSCSHHLLMLMYPRALAKISQLPVHFLATSQQQPDATYCYRWSRSVCVSVGHICESCKWWRIRWETRSPTGRGKFWGLSGPLKSIVSPCCSLCGKIYRSVIINGTAKGIIHSSITACSESDNSIFNNDMTSHVVWCSLSS